MRRRTGADCEVVLLPHPTATRRIRAACGAAWAKRHAVGLREVRCSTPRSHGNCRSSFSTACRVVSRSGPGLVRGRAGRLGQAALATVPAAAQTTLAAGDAALADYQFEEDAAGFEVHAT
jgi:hypothetical protein